MCGEYVNTKIWQTTKNILLKDASGNEKKKTNGKIRRKLVTRKANSDITLFFVV